MKKTLLILFILTFCLLKIQSQDYVNKSLTVRNPPIYPYGINIDCDYPANWAREFNLTHSVTKNIFSFGAYGNGSQLVYGYIGGGATSTVNSASPWMTFLPSGNVGIGTVSPKSKLDVNGTIQAKSLNIDNELVVGKQVEPLNGGSINRIVIIPYRHTGGPWTIKSRDTQSIASLDIAYGANNLMSFHHNFQVDINGTLLAKEVKVEAIAWSDYVFDKNYELPTLTEVENHIKEYRHLPDVPSEKEVLANGVNVVEMQAKLLQKIEELTLYVIDLKKENQHQEKLIEDLQSQLSTDK